ncbi:MAG: ABC transporter permease [Dehalococcoidia bacterium]|nr:ABC transporter permease [Dehalococcoidia bacterium]
MLRHIWAITWKDLKILVRNRSALLLLFAMPVGFVLVMTSAMSGLFTRGQSAISVLVVNEDQGELSSQIVEGLKAAKGFKVETEWDGQTLTTAKAEELITSRKRQLAVIFPQDFSRNILAGVLPSQNQQSPAAVQLMLDPSLSEQFTGPIIGTLQGLILQSVTPVGIEQLLQQTAPGMKQEQRQAIIEQAQQKTLTGVRIEQTTPTGMSVRKLPNTTQQNVPSYALFGVFFICQVIGLSFIHEKQDGTFRRLLVAPISKSALLIGKLLPYYLVNLIQIVLIFAAGIWIVPLMGNPALNLGEHPEALIVVSLATAAAACGLGLLVAALVKTPEATGGLGALIAVMMAAIGGCFVPIFVMPNLMQTLSKIVPHSWALQGYQNVLIRGYDIGQVMPEVGVLLLFAAVFFGFALWRFRFD